MDRRAFLKAVGSAAALLPLLPHRIRASTNLSRRRPSDAAWPSQSAWKQLNDAVGGNLIPVEFPLSVLKSDPDGDAAKQLLKNLKNPYFLGDEPGLTESTGWVDALRQSEATRYGRLYTEVFSMATILRPISAESSKSKDAPIRKSTTRFPLWASIRF